MFEYALKFSDRIAKMSLMMCVLGLPVAGWAQMEYQPTRGYWQEQIQTLPQLPDGWQLIPESIVVSPNRQHMACKMQRGSGIIVVFNGKPSPVYRKVGKLIFSANSVYLYYSARELGPWYFIRNNRRVFAKEIVGDPIPSASGNKCAIIFKTPRKYKVHINHTEGPIFDEVDPQSISFSPNDKQYAYFARRGQHWYVQINDKTAGPYSQVSGKPVFDADSNQLAYIAQFNDQWYVVQNNEPWRVANDAVGLQFHPTSNNLFAWLRIESQQWQLYSDNQPIENGLSTTPAQLVFGNHPNAWAARLTIGSQTQMIRNGKLLPILGYILPDAMQFDIKSIQLVYVTRTDAGEHLTIDEQLLDPCQTIQTSDIIIGKDARRIAYAAKVNDKWHVIDQGQPGPAVESIVPGSMQFSLEQHLIFRAQAGSFVQLYANNQMVGEFNEMTEPVFTRGHIGWAARLGQKWRIYIDGVANDTTFTDLVAQPQIATKHKRFVTMIQQNHTLMPSYSKLVLEQISAEEALANVDPNSIK